MLFMYIYFMLCLATSSSYIKHIAKRGSLKLQMIAATGRNLNIEVNGNTICYDFFKAESSSSPPILYLPGLTCPKNEPKSISLQSWCKKNDVSFLCADYYGVGRSSGKFEDGTVGSWVKDTIFILEKVLEKSTHSKAILVAHGVGTWISFLVAKTRPDLVRGIVGMSTDPDFTEELLWKKLSEDIKNKIMTEGVAEIMWGNTKYPISKKLIEDGRQNLLLTDKAGSIPIKCPVRLMHAIEDEEVPFTLALQLIKGLATHDASVVLLKGSTHAMDDEADFRTMKSMIREIMEAKDGYDLRSPASG